MSSPALKVGLLAGFLFFAHALLPNSHAWPLIWPLLGGALAVYAKARSDTLASVKEGFGISAKTGLIAALFFFGATAIALAVLSLGGSAGAAQMLGADSPVIVNSGVLTALGLAAFIGLGAAIVAGLATYPLVRRSH